jgi:predicted ArsR family transcriptional regulator
VIGTALQEETISDAKRRLLHHLKTNGPSCASALAKWFGLTDVAVRQHLTTMAEAGLVSSQRQAPRGRGRPSLMWSLTERAEDLFPDRHAELSVSLLKAIQEAYGEDGLDRIIALRTRNCIEDYRDDPAMDAGTLQERVEALAARRAKEGYMSEVIQEDDFTYLLVEHHCPIFDAATRCRRLSDADIEVLRSVFSGLARVERVMDPFEGERCIYRISEI